jgi:hypothetical protein
MPHDANGELLNVGDYIVITAAVKEIHQTDKYCNLMVKVNRLMPPDETETNLSLNAKQVEKLKPAPEPVVAVKWREDEYPSAFPSVNEKRAIAEKDQAKAELSTLEEWARRAMRLLNHSEECKRQSDDCMCGYCAIRDQAIKLIS